jgi:hypothetical protein
MRITITIPDEFAAEVQSRGLNPETYVEDLLAKQLVPPSSPPLSKEERMANLEKFFRGISAHTENVPPLPDEAFTRESFYRDRD